MTTLKLRNSNPTNRFNRFPQASDLFSDFFNTATNYDINKTEVPAVNILENDESFKLEVAAPGLTRENFKISVDNDIITIIGEKKSESNDQNEKFTRKEFSFTSFQRSFSLPDFIDVDAIGATYEDGLMKIVLPKKEEAKQKGPKEIKVS